MSTMMPQNESMTGKASAKGKAKVATPVMTKEQATRTVEIARADEGFRKVHTEPEWVRVGIVRHGDSLYLVYRKRGTGHDLNETTFSGLKAFSVAVSWDEVWFPIG